MKTDNFKNEIEEVNSSLNPVPQNRLSSIFGNFEVVDTAPTAVPTTLDNQIKIYVNGATKRLYIYESVNGSWLYTSLT